MKKITTALTGKLLLFVFLSLVVVASCKKDSDPDPTPPNPPTPPVTGTQKPKKFLVDSTVSAFLSSVADITGGVFKYNSLPGIDSIKKGDFFIEPRGFGYLRKVESITKNTNEVIINTSPGKLSEFYQDSALIKRRFSIPPIDNPFHLKSDAFQKTTFAFNTIEMKMGVSTIKLENFEFSFDPTFVFDASISGGYLKAGIENTVTKLKYDLSIAVEPALKSEAEIKLSSVYPSLFKTIKLNIPNLFMQVSLVDFVVRVTLEAGGKGEKKYSYKNEMVTDAYVEYKNGALGAVCNTTNSVYEYTKHVSFNGGIKGTLEIFPVIQISEFGIPLVNIGPKAVMETDLRYSPLYDTWDLKAEAYAAFYGNFKNTILENVPLDEYQVKAPAKLLFATPRKLQYISGGDEFPNPNSLLQNPIVFEVLEQNNWGTSETEPFVNVFFSSDYGHWTNDKVKTGIDGHVQNTFTMGPEKKEHVLTAVIKDASNQVVDTKIIKITPNGPASAFIVSGLNQQGFPQATLPSPLVVGVKDMNGVLMSGVNINWAVTSGGGQLSQSTTTTISSGQSFNTWTLGASGDQIVTATVKKNDGTDVAGSPLTFGSNVSSDSLEYYKNIVLGDWSVAYYEGGQLVQLHQDNRITLLPGGVGNWYETRYLDGSIISHPPSTPNATWSITRLGNNYILKIQGAEGRITPSQLTFTNTGGVFGNIARKL
jgi:hypothetical protein